ncbi:MAG: transposase [Gammaproteobacteria bacterium]
MILALTIMLETVDNSRFKQAGHFASYCRCVGGARYGNGKKKGTSNTKNGNKHLAWALVKGANSAIRRNETLNKYYQRKLAKNAQDGRQENPRT